MNITILIATKLLFAGVVSTPRTKTFGCDKKAFNLNFQMEN